MASEKVIQYFDKTFGEYNYKCRLQDFTDEEIRTALTNTKPRHWGQVEDYLMSTTKDPEVRAHLKGFDSAAEREELVQTIQRKIEEYYG